MAEGFDTYDDVMRGYYPFPYPTAAGNLMDGRTVITSLLIVSHAQFAIGFMRTRDGSIFDGKQVDSTVTTLASEAVALGTQGRVITGLSFNGNGVRYLNYGWDQNGGTQYETVVKAATFQDYAVVAADVSSQGYVITAFTGDTEHGILMVGTRVKGDTLPRPFLAGGTGDMASKGYAPVGRVRRLSDNNAGMLIGQK